MSNKINKNLLSSILKILKEVVTDNTPLFIKDKTFKAASVNTSIQYDFKVPELTFANDLLTLTYDKLNLFVSNVSNEIIEHTVKVNHILKAGNVSIKVKKVDANTFEPVIPCVIKDKDNFYTLPQNINFLRIIEHMIELGAASNYSNLSAIKLVLKNGSLNTFATDRYRFLSMSLKNTDNSKDFTGCIPIKLFGTFKTLMGFGGDNYLIFSDKLITIHGEVTEFDLNITAPLLDDGFPASLDKPTRDLNAATDEFEIDVQKFHDSIKIYRASASDKKETMRIGITPKSTELTMDIGQQSLASECDTKTIKLLSKQAISFGANVHFLGGFIDLLRHLKIEKTTIKFISNKCIGFNLTTDGINVVYIISIL